jgi:transcriptional regulator with XRE-family HTH domain
MPGFSGAAINLVRRRRGLSARALSLQAGLSAAYVHKFEAGLIEPSMRAFARLVVALGMTPEEAYVCLVAEATRRD